MVSDSTITSADVQDGSLTRADMGESLIRLGVTQGTTSGTFKEFTSIPSWARRITANGTDAFDQGAVNISWE